MDKIGVVDDTIVGLLVVSVVEVTLGTLALLGAIVVREGAGRGSPSMLGVAGSFSRHLGPSKSVRILIILENRITGIKEKQHFQEFQMFKVGSYFGNDHGKKKKSNFYPKAYLL